MRKWAGLTGELVLRHLDDKSGLTWGELINELDLENERSSSHFKELVDCFDTLFNLELVHIPKLSPEYIKNKVTSEPRYSLGLDLHYTDELKNLRIFTARKWHEIQNALSGPRTDRSSFITVSPLFGKPERTEKQRDIFVMMPFKGEMNTIYKDHIAAVAEEMELSVIRADDLYAPGMIIQDIWKMIFGSGMIIADLTGQNANVFYELGIAHTVGKPVVMMARSIDDVPFDLRHLRTIIYDYTVIGMKTFERHLKLAIRETLGI